MQKTIYPTFALQADTEAKGFKLDGNWIKPPSASNQVFACKVVMMPFSFRTFEVIIGPVTQGLIVGIV